MAAWQLIMDVSTIPIVSALAPEGLEGQGPRAQCLAHSRCLINASFTYE